MTNGLRFLVAALIASCPTFAQTTTNLSLANMGGLAASVTAARAVTLSGTGVVSPLGPVTVGFSGSQDQSSYRIQGTFTFAFNRLDTLTVSALPQPVSKVTSLTLAGAVSGGTGIYAGATGSIIYTFQYTGLTSESGTFALSGSGNITVGTTKTSISLEGFGGTASITKMVSGELLKTPSGSVNPFGSATVKFTGIENSSLGRGRIQGTLTFVFNGNDSFNASFAFTYSAFSTSISLPCSITGGTGSFQGATGSLNAALALNLDGSFTLTGSGSITQPAAGGPVISSVSTAFGASYIAQNTWLQIQGTNLTPSTTPVGGVFWSDAPEFKTGRMPTQVGGIRVTVNGKPAYVWWFCSAATTPACSSDQINVLSPLDDMVGQVQVVVTNQKGSSAPMSVNMLALSPSFLLFDVKGHSVAEHTNFSFLGPPNLFPTVPTTPAHPAEVVIVYAIGFGLPANSLVDGSATQAGSLPVLPVCQMGGSPAPVTAAVLVSPGLYALFVTVPNGATTGDTGIACSYQNAATPAGNLITVQR